MFGNRVARITHWLGRAVTEPREELNRWQRAARFAYDLGRHGARQLKEDRAAQMAAALAFRTLFGLAPVLVVATIVVKAVRGADAISNSLHQLFVAAGLDNIHVVSAVTSATESGESAVTLAAWLETLVGDLASVNLSAIGWIGFALIVYAAIGLMVTIENSFNTIYRASDGRRWARRVPLYWFVLTISPAFLGIASYANQQWTTLVTQLSSWQWWLLAVQFFWSFAIAWLLMTVVYKLVPNANVALRPAVTGAFVAALLLEIGKRTLGSYLGNAFAINQLYGSLGLVPLFMFWVYLMWLAVLFGLQVSATLQMLHGRSLRDMERRQARLGLVDPTSVLLLMELVVERFLVGQPVTARELAEFTAIPEAVTIRVLDRLVQEGWLHRIDRPEAAVSLALPPDQLPAVTFLKLGFRWLDEGRDGRHSALVESLRAAQHTVAEGITLATLATSRPNVAPG